MTAALTTEGLHTYYGKSHILHGVNLSVALFGPGRAVARLIRRADRARDAGGHSRAAKFYCRALKLDPGRTDIRVQYGNMLRR